MKPKRGLTLVELLITMAIIAILAAMALGTAHAAMESARRSRTVSTIKKLDGLLNEYYELYTTRRLNIHPDITASIQAMVVSDPNDPTVYQKTSKLSGSALADARLLGLRELMKYEMPDRWSDVLEDPQVLAIVPSITQAYRIRYNALKTVPEGVREQYQGAETLYLVVMNLTGDGEARTHFTPQEIGDFDGDGANEFLDGWGQPISWLRWPAYFKKSTKITGDAAADHDPFDPYHRDDPKAVRTMVYPPGNMGLRNVPQIMSRLLPPLSDAHPAYRLPPLVYSAGPDGSLDVNNSTGGAANLDPYDPEKEVGKTGDIDQDGTDNSTDDIFNLIAE